MITFLTSQNLLPQDAQAIADLYRQLDPHLTQLPIAEVLRRDTTYLMVYREQEQIRGMATLACYRVVSGYKGWIEDVVVDQALRGRGIGKQLMQAVLEKARSLSLQQLFLYTEEDKQAAIRMYENLGFTRKGSRIYCLTVG